MRRTRSGTSEDNNNNNDENNNEGWNSYNNASAISFGFEYKWDRYCGNIKVRNAKIKSRIWSFTTHPSAKMFHLMKNYPTLVGLDNPKLMELVAENESMSIDLVEKSEKVEALKTRLENAQQEYKKGLAKSQQELEEAANVAERQTEALRQEYEESTSIVRQQANHIFEEELKKQKKEVKAEQANLKKMYVQKLDDVMNEKRDAMEEMEEMEKVIEQLEKTSNKYKASYIQSQELCNLTVSALSSIKHIPRCIKTLHRQIDFKNMAFNAILSDFGDDIVSMISSLPSHFVDGDTGILERQINSRIYGIMTGSYLQSVVEDGYYTFEALANLLPTVSQFDILFKSVKIKTTTRMTRRNKQCNKLLSNFKLDDIVSNLNQYGANILEEEIDGNDKQYYLYCLSQVLLSNKDASMVEASYEIMEPIRKFIF